MICPVCKGHIGFSKVTEISSPIDLKGISEDNASEVIGDTGKFYNKNDYEILCNTCDQEKGREVEMEEEKEPDPHLSFIIIENKLNNEEKGSHEPIFETEEELNNNAEASHNPNPEDEDR